MHLPRDAHDQVAPSTTDTLPLPSALPSDCASSSLTTTSAATLLEADTSPEATFVSALHAAFQSLTPGSPAASSTHSLEQDMSFGPFKDREKASLEIALTSDQLTLKGIGSDVEPALLSGNVVLSLTQSTSFKSITLIFKGKARVPGNPNEAHVLNNATSVFSLCNHEWSFLEGEKRHTHTLKPGRHVFPFELRIGGSLPSSIATYANGGASISYKLRATAVRPGLAKSNLTASVPIQLSRTFASEALEYQQSLEIENSWPDKLMYSLVLPHKAWAAGDALTTMVKFAPLAKGVRVVSIATTICETTKTYTKGSEHLEATRTVLQKRHEIVNGKAECAEDLRMRQIQRIIRDAVTSSPAHTQSVVGSSLVPFMVSQPLHPALTSAYVYNGRTPSEPSGQPTESSNLSNDRSIAPIRSEPASRDTAPSNNHAARSLALPPSSSSTPSSHEIDDEPTNDDVVTTISVLLPPTLTPSHALDPIIVSYRVRWSVLLSNADGHTSELRCSLPIHILDHRHLATARTASRTTRRLLLGPSFVPGGRSDDRDGAEAEEEEEEEAELPSYPQHVRDRVANAFLQDAATVRVANPWVVNRVDPIGSVRRRVASASSTSVGSSSGSGSTFRTTSVSSPSTRPSSSGSGAAPPGTSSGLGLHLGIGSRLGLHLGSRSPSHSESRLPPPQFSLTGPDSGAPTPGVEWMTSELVLSMTDIPTSLASPSEGNLTVSSSRPGQSSRTNPRDSRANSRPTSRSGSRWASRIASRAGSPDRGTNLPSTSSASGADASLILNSSSNVAHGNVSPANSNGVGGSNSQNTSSSSAGPSVAHRDETHVHNNNPSSRQQHGIFSATLKPVPSITPPWSSAHAHAHAHIAAVAQSSQSRSHSNPSRTRGAGSAADMVLLGAAPSRPQSHSRPNTPRSQPHSNLQSPLHTSIQLPSTSDPLIGAVLLHRAFTEVPDYAISSRGFLGGGAPPLDTLRDLPTYESSEAARRAMPVLAAVQEAN